MRSYLAILKGRISVLFQYRAAALAGLATQIFWGYVKVMILQAFYLNASGVQPISLQQAITFTWLGQALLQLVPWNIDKEIEHQIRNGNVAYELIRPIDLYGMWFFRSLAMRVVPTVMRFTPLFILALLVFDMSPPFSWQASIFFVFSLLFAGILSAAMTTLIVISLFWTLSGDGILRLLPHISILLAGLAIPLPLFPDWMQPFLNIQPFRGVIDIPSRIYTGVISSDEAIYYLAFQLVWSLVFIAIGRKLMGTGLKKLVIQGG